MRRKSEGFTLIELLIVVAIIAILAAIAVPNFLEAQTRAKVSRTKTDMRTLVTGLESYRVDNNSYPPASCSLRYLSTPIAYLANGRIFDPFGTEAITNTCAENSNGESYYYYYPIEQLSTGAVTDLMGPYYTPGNQTIYQGGRFILDGHGPDRTLEVYRNTVTGRSTILGTASAQEFADAAASSVQCHFIGWCIYDPTNGTVSRGDISRNVKGEMKGSGNYN